MVHLWDSCLPGRGFGHEAKIPLFSSEETAWAGSPVNDCRHRKWTHPPRQGDGIQEVFDFPPSPFRIKEAWIVIQAAWFFGTQIHHLLSLLAFQTTSLVLVPTARLGLLACGVMNQTSLDSVTLRHHVEMLAGGSRGDLNRSRWGWRAWRQTPLTEVSIPFQNR